MHGDFKAELIMVRLCLLEGVAEKQKRRGSKLSQEIEELCTMAVNLQPCWVCAPTHRSSPQVPAANMNSPALAVPGIHVWRRIHM